MERVGGGKKLRRGVGQAGSRQFKTEYSVFVVFSIVNFAIAKAGIHTHNSFFHFKWRNVNFNLTNTMLKWLHIGCI